MLPTIGLNTIHRIGYGGFLAFHHWQHWKWLKIGCLDITCSYSSIFDDLVEKIKVLWWHGVLVGWKLPHVCTTSGVGIQGIVFWGSHGWVLLFLVLLVRVWAVLLWCSLCCFFWFFQDCFYLFVFVFAGLGVCCSSCAVWHRNGTFVCVACPLVAVVACYRIGSSCAATVLFLIKFSCSNKKFHIWIHAYVACDEYCTSSCLTL